MKTPTSEGLTRSQLSRLIDEYIFSQRDRYILKRKLLDDASMDEIAEEMGLTPNCIKKRFQAAKHYLELSI